MNITITRTNGPCNDRSITMSDILPKETQIIADTLAAVNAVGNNTEKWSYQIENGNVIIPKFSI